VEGRWALSTEPGWAHVDVWLSTRCAANLSYHNNVLSNNIAA
jgi:hypothetical protein